MPADHARLKAALTRQDLLDEMHHLFWVDAQENQGKWDEGWNCRDHALVTAALAQLMGFTAIVGYGQAMFVQGPSAEVPPVGLNLSMHAWTMVERGGVYDLSPRLSRTKLEGWRPSSVAVIAQDSCEPSVGTKFTMVLEEPEFDDAVARATHDEGRFHAIFKGETTNDLSKAILGDSLNFCNSILTDQLLARFGSKGDLHAKAILHLWEFLKGQATGIRHLPQWEAWGRISERKGDAVYRVCSRARIL